MEKNSSLGEQNDLKNGNQRLLYRRTDRVFRLKYKHFSSQNVNTTK